MSADVTWESLRDGLPDHATEIMASHPGRPTPAEAVDRGVTPSSGSDDTQGPMPGPIGGY